jgi:hypothetical protein
MRRNRVLASLITVTLAALSIGSATAWFSDSATLRFEISAADDFDGSDGGTVWVCKLIGPSNAPTLKPGKNPIHVAANSLDAEEAFSDAYPSYVVEHGDVVCLVPAISPIEPPEKLPEPRAIETPSEDAAIPDPPTTTSTIAETTSSSSTPSTSTTTSSIPPPTTTTTDTAPTSATSTPEELTTTTSTDPDIDE